jgi:protein-tyrosine-phosphatase
MVADADLIAVMEENHKIQLGKRYPEADEKIRLLKSFIPWYPGLGSDVSDPYRLKKYHYRFCFKEISAAIDAMLNVL